MAHRSRLAGGCGCLAAAAITAAVPAGPSWVEPDDTDAGAPPPSAMVTVGTGPMLAIRGTLNGSALGVGAGDFEDMYVISIDDPASFSATTALSPGFAEFDSRLFLFDINGLGLLGNDNGGSAAVPVAVP